MTFRVEVLDAKEAGGEGSTARLRFQVEDTGMGMSPEQVERLFIAFEQVGRERAKEGTGLGLVISQMIVQLMGSAIRVRTAVGERRAQEPPWHRAAPTVDRSDEARSLGPGA